jgi:hypothetical protein
MAGSFWMGSRPCFGWGECRVCDGGEGSEGCLPFA